MIRNIKFSQPKNADYLRVKGRNLLAESNEPYMPEYLQPYTGEFPVAYEYTTAEGDNQEQNKQYLPAKLRHLIETRLHIDGAILIKNLPIKDSTDFGELMQKAGFKKESYIGGTVTRNTKEVVEVPTNDVAEQSMESHHDIPFYKYPVERLSFFYEQPAVDSVNNMLDGRLYYQSLDKQIIEKFEKLGIRYENYYPKEVDPNQFETGQLFVPWSKIFQTESKQEVEKFLSNNGAHFQWLEGDDLLTWTIQPPSKPHPITGEKCWQNSVTTFNGRYFHDKIECPELKKYSYYDENKFQESSFNRYPFDTKYGDGTIIEKEVMEHLTEKLWKLSIGVKNETGDLILVDNFVAGHGRLGYTPPRKAWVFSIRS